MSNPEPKSDDDNMSSPIEQKGELYKCKICGVKFDNASAIEGHMAAGHLTAS